MIDAIVERAFTAYFRSGGTDQAGRDSSECVRLNGKDYVVLRNAHGALAVYRVRPHNGALRRLKRPPAELLV